MPKIIGISETYGPTGLIESYYSPYSSIGATMYPRAGTGYSYVYDLSQPGRVAEIKRALVLATKFWMEQNGKLIYSRANADRINLFERHKDSWDGPSADTLIDLIGRWQHLIDDFDDPEDYYQYFDDFNQTVGGPQPTLRAIEMLRQVGRNMSTSYAIPPEVFGLTEPLLPLYEQWRSTQDIPTFSDVPEGEASLIMQHGPPDVEYGWIQANVNSPVAKSTPWIVGELDRVDGELKTLWWKLAKMDSGDEDERLDLSHKILENRRKHNEIATTLAGGNVPKPIPETVCMLNTDCPDGYYCNFERDPWACQKADSPSGHSCLDSRECISGLCCNDICCDTNQECIDWKCTSPGGTQPIQPDLPNGDKTKEESSSTGLIVVGLLVAAGVAYYVLKD